MELPGTNYLLTWDYDSRDLGEIVQYDFTENNQIEQYRGQK